MSVVKIRALIADDEPLARKGLKKLLAAEQAVEVVAECEDGIQAVELIQERRPDVAFLDIQMPGLDGFGVVDAVGIARMPVTVFVTAYDLHAMRAFDVHAVDYLLKPVTAERLHVAVARAAAILKQPDRTALEKKVEALLRSIRPTGEWLERFVIRSVGKVTIAPVADVDWIEADGDYVRLHTAQKVHLHRERMSALEKKLDPSSSSASTAPPSSGYSASANSARSSTATTSSCSRAGSNSPSAGRSGKRVFAALQSAG